MSTENDTPKQMDTQTNTDTEATPPIPDSRPRLDLTEIADADRSMYVDRMAELLDVFVDITTCERAIYAATVYADDTEDWQLTVNDLEEYTWYTYGSIYQKIRDDAPLIEYGLVKADRTRPATVEATVDGLRLAETLLEDYGINVYELVRPFYAAPERETPVDTADGADTATTNTPDADPTDPESPIGVDDEIYLCTLCGTVEPSRRKAERHVTERSDADHEGVSGQTVGVIEGPTERREQKKQREMEQRRKEIVEQEDDEEPSPMGNGLDALDSVLAVNDASDDTSSGSDSSSSSSFGSGSWQTFDERPVGNGDDNGNSDTDSDTGADGETDPDTDEKIAAALEEAVLSMGERVAKPAETNLNRERVRALQLQAMAQATEAYYTAKYESTWKAPERREDGER